MSDRNRLIDFTFGCLTAGIFILVVTFAAHAIFSDYAKIIQVYATYQANSDKDKEETEKRIQDYCVGIAPAQSASCINNYLSAYYAKESSKADLKAQKDMAQWAFLTFLASMGGVLVGFIGIYFVRLTLSETARTADASVVAAEAARRAAVVAEESLYITQRARVGLTGFKTEKIMDQGRLVGWKISPFLRNTGATPARITKNVFGIQPFDNEVALGDWDFIVPDHPGPLVVMLQANGESRGEPVDAALDHFLRLWRGEQIGVACGRIEYDTVFPSLGKRVTKYFFRIAFKDDPSTSDDPFMFMAIGEHSEET